MKSIPNGFETLPCKAFLTVSASVGMLLTGGRGRGDLTRKDRWKGEVQPPSAAAGLGPPTCPCVVACRGQAALGSPQ